MAQLPERRDGQLHELASIVLGGLAFAQAAGHASQPADPGFVPVGQLPSQRLDRVAEDHLVG